MSLHGRPEEPQVDSRTVLAENQASWRHPVGRACAERPVGSRQNASLDSHWQVAPYPCSEKLRWTPSVGESVVLVRKVADGRVLELDPRGLAARGLGARGAWNPEPASRLRMAGRRATGDDCGPSGGAIRRSPRSHAAVSECRSARGVPWNTTSPSRSPGPGPRSMIRSAAPMICVSCSTTSRVLPTARSLCSTETMRAMSRACSPMLCSSSTNRVTALRGLRPVAFRQRRVGGDAAGRGLRGPSSPCIMPVVEREARTGLVRSTAAEAGMPPPCPARPPRKAHPEPVQERDPRDRRRRDRRPAGEAAWTCG